MFEFSVFWEASQTTVKISTVSLDPNKGGEKISCGGSWLSERSILTAAHCIEDLSRNLGDPLLLTAYPKGRQADPLFFEKRRIYFEKHPSYDPNSDSPQYDLGILTFASEEQLPTRATVSLGLYEPLSPDHDRLLYTGTGSFDIRAFFQSLPDEDRRVISQGLGKRIENITDLEARIIFASLEGTRDLQSFFVSDITSAHDRVSITTPKGIMACLGDSGGPLFVRNSSGKSLSQVGLHAGMSVSHREPLCSSQAHAAVFDEDNLLWIDETLKNLENRPQR